MHSDIGRAHHPDQLVLSALLQDTDSPVAFLTESGKVQRCNPAFAELLGMTTERAESSDLTDLLPAPVAAERIAIIRRTLAQGKPIGVDGLFRGRLMRWTIRPVEAEEGGSPAVLVTCSRLGDRSAGGAAIEIVRASHEDPGGLASLTDREREVLGLIGLGLSTTDIAERLYRSAKTIEGHRVSLGVKLGVQNRVQLARIAIRAGLSPLSTAEVELKPDHRPVG
ncbi:MAG: PAS domain-containing protein [Phycisphaerales bacterium]|nr:PAS domain-containing protein [Phycisphaerales bacterium]